MGLAQTTTGEAKTDTLKSSAPAAGAKQDRKASQKGRDLPDSSAFGKEMELETISIEAVIEKPNVDIIPKRTRPDFGEVQFIDRSFEHELKAIPKDLLLIDDDLDRVAKLEGLKKLLESKKKK
jgi:hypothetical protein